MFFASSFAKLRFASVSSMFTKANVVLYYESIFANPTRNESAHLVTFFAAYIDSLITSVLSNLLADRFCTFSEHGCICASVKIHHHS